MPRDKDLGLYLNLLARSATGQHITVYTHFLTGPRKGNTLKGPEEMHVIFLDNGRIDLINTEYRDVLNCIRCGACQNVCPVYRQSSGHAYRGVYAGPIGGSHKPCLCLKQKLMIIQIYHLLLVCAVRVMKCAP